ncbi:hypothetical protein DFQ28_005520 [Apophysomyces sp. BC1034]|nr:hypothetical protein DFQ30_006948 [Apophysomyces sp. BC1015]KAG0177679.1 hypothetical protein DFQ29_004534 [Apophysomyces sp. BC1021]KAG0187986.1 hypothetical protein DFQ28_005520 [Apophysomyces sp. BC1034]
MIRRPSSIVTLQKSDVNEFDALRFVLDAETRTKAEERIKKMVHSPDMSKSDVTSDPSRPTDKTEPSSTRKRRKVHGQRMTTRQRLGIDELPAEIGQADD